MDNREDEQSRGITMKSSAISLRYINEGTTYVRTCLCYDMFCFSNG